MRVLCSRLEAHVRPLRAKVDVHEKKLPRRYKQNYDRLVRGKPVYKPSDYIDIYTYPGLPSLVATKDQDTKQLATGAYHKLLPRSSGPFRAISVQSSTVPIDEHGIENTVSIDPVLHALAMRRN